jgi:hypothetical protein
MENPTFNIQKLIDLMADQEVTDNDLVRASGVHYPQYVGRWRAGSQPSIADLWRLAQWSEEPMESWLIESDTD